MPQLPDPEWISLSEARDRALAVFAGSDPGAVERAILEAIYDATINTRGRCQKWFRHGERVRLRASIWDPELVRIRWDAACFVRAEGRDAWLFVHVQLSRRDLENWVKQVAPRETAADQTSEDETCELASINEPASVDAASDGVRRQRPEPRKWRLARVVAIIWLNDNGAPEPRDGNQAKLERHIAEFFVERGYDAGEATIRRHVTEWIREYRDALGV